VADIKHAQPGSAWSHILDTPEPVEDVDLRKRTVPVDFGPVGVFARSDGKEARKTYHVDLTFKEMVEGIYTGKGPRMELEGKEYDVEDLVAEAPAKYLELQDQYDHSQGDPYPWDAIFRAHVLRLVKGWKHEKALHTYLKKRPFLVADLGFDSIPNQSTLWRAWEDRFTDEVKEAIRITAEIAVEHARKHDAPAPDPDFLPEMDIDDDDDETAEALARDKARQVWRQANRSSRTVSSWTEPTTPVSPRGRGGNSTLTWVCGRICTQTLALNLSQRTRRERRPPRVTPTAIN
jgi:hypothetical protein